VLSMPEQTSTRPSFDIDIVSLCPGDLRRASITADTMRTWERRERHGQEDPGHLARIAVLTAAVGLLAACTSPDRAAARPRLGQLGPAAGQPDSGRPPPRRRRPAPSCPSSSRSTRSPGPHRVRPGQLRRPRRRRSASSGATTPRPRTADAPIDAAFSSAAIPVRRRRGIGGHSWLKDKRLARRRQPVCAGPTTARDHRRDRHRHLPDSTRAAPARRLKGITPPEATLKGNDSLNPDQLSWYTTAEGSRIAEINHRRQYGGAIVAWVIIERRRRVRSQPCMFYFQDKSFIDDGVIQSAQPQPVTGWRPARSTSSAWTTPTSQPTERQQECRSLPLRSWLPGACGVSGPAAAVAAGLTPFDIARHQRVDPVPAAFCRSVRDAPDGSTGCR